MKVLLVHQYFKTPDEGGGIRSYHIAKHLISQGHEVTVLTGGRANQSLQIDGIDIQYFDITYSNKFPAWRRVYAFWKFVICCRRYVEREGQFELAYVITTPLTTALIALYYKRKFKLDYAFEVGDLWPDVPVLLGFLKNKWLKRYFYGLERKAYKEAKKLIGLSDPIAEAMKKKSGRTDVLVATNMSDCDFFQPNTQELTNGELTIGYLGTIGYANQIERILKLAEYCSEHKLAIRFEIMGEGAQKSILKSQYSSLKNVRWHSGGGMKRVREIIQGLDAVIISYRKDPILETGSPNKLFDGLAAGKLIITNFGGWISELIESEGCGFKYLDDDFGEFQNQLQPYLKDRNVLSQAKAKAGNLAKSRFDVHTVTHSIEQFLTN